jgi:hypothetical protein
MNKKCSIDGCSSTSCHAKGLCKSHYNKQLKLNSIEKIREQNRVSRQKRITTDKGRFMIARLKAKERKLDFDLSLEDFTRISKLPCHYCNDKLCGKKILTGCHLDRIDNSKGYTLDNVLSCGQLCNSIRMDILTVEETEDAVVAIIAGREFRYSLESHNGL